MPVCIPSLFVLSPLLTFASFLVLSYVAERKPTKPTTTVAVSANPMAASLISHHHQHNLEQLNNFSLDGGPLSSFTPGGSNKSFASCFSGLIVGSGGGFSQVKPRFPTTTVNDLPLRPHSLIALESNSMECDNTSLGGNESLSPMATITTAGSGKRSQSKQDYKYLMDIILSNSSEPGTNTASANRFVPTSMECDDDNLVQSPTLAAAVAAASTTNNTTSNITNAPTSNFSIFGLNNFTAQGNDPGGGDTGASTSTAS